MGNVLICTIGNRDVVLTDQQHWPPHLRDPQPGERRPVPGARERGAYLRAHFDELQTDIQLPIISKALGYIRQATQRLDDVVLIVSNQSQDVKPEYRGKDTIEFGHAIKEWLSSHPQWKNMVSKSHIFLKEVKGNPADFDDMQHFFRRELPLVRQRSGPDQTYYLALSGGTPAMTAMLLFVGSDVFGKTCEPLYISDSLKLPLPLTVSQRIYQQSVRAAILIAVRGFNYATAAQLLGNEHVLDSRDRQQSLRALLAYAQQRSVFDFESAQCTLASVVNLLSGHPKRQMVALREDMAGLSNEWKLRETCFGADIKYRTEAYFDFLTRVFRFHEGILQWQVQEWGAEFADESTRRLKAEWVTSTPGLDAWFTQRGIEYRERDVSRHTLVALVEFLAPQHGKEAIVPLIQQIDGLANLRNKTVHDFTGISKQLLAQKFTRNNQADPCQADHIVNTMRQIYERVVGQPVGPNPFDQINELIADLLNEAR
jgi:hypothetical protein